MSWGIAETASELEKLKSESADYLNGLNSCGEIDYSTYSQAFDFYADLIEKAYKFGKDTNVPSNDTISRTDAIDAVAYAEDGKDAQRILEDLPSAQPEYLHVIMEKIRKNYEKAMNVSYINDPMAVALSETWKEYVDEKDHKRG